MGERQAINAARHREPRPNPVHQWRRDTGCLAPQAQPRARPGSDNSTDKEGGVFLRVGAMVTTRRETAV